MLRSTPSLASLALAAGAAIFLLAVVIILPDPLQADPLPAQREHGAVVCPEPQSRNIPKLWHIPRFAKLVPEFDQADETATLQAIHYVLSEVADGSVYVWHRRNGRSLNGLVRAERSFRDPAGAICRKIEVSLSAGEFNRTVSGVACREADKSWTFKS